MKCGEIVTVDLLKRIVSYDSFTGYFRWIERSPDMFEDTLGRTKEHSCKNWNSMYAGKECFKQNHDCGYKMGTIWNVKYLAHRVAWAVHYGEWPNLLIDHINGIPWDNRICNLRIATSVSNSHNSEKPSTNTSGFKGASYCKQTGRWTAKIRKDGENVWLGRHDSVEEAHAAYDRAARKIHGEFYRKND